MTTFEWHNAASSAQGSRWRDEIDRAEALVPMVALFLMVTGTGLAGTIGTLNMTGAVPLMQDIAVTPNIAAGQLDLSINQPPLTVAGVRVASNNPSGYRVTVASANVTSGNCGVPCLFTSGGGNSSLPFTLYRDGVPISFVGPIGVFVTAGGLSQAGGDGYLVRVSYDGSSANLPRNNDYRETLTFTLSVS
jgi:hypothetical protein